MISKNWKIDFIRSEEYHTYDEVIKHQHALWAVLDKKKNKPLLSTMLRKLPNQMYVVDALILKNNGEQHKGQDNQCKQEDADKILAGISKTIS